jgi:hypothetical protein
MERLGHILISGFAAIIQTTSRDRLSLDCKFSLQEGKCEEKFLLTVKYTVSETFAFNVARKKIRGEIR